MKRLILPTLLATLLLTSGCTPQPSAPVEPQIDPSLPKVHINGHIESMSSIAFEWKPSKDPRVKGYYVYRNDPETNEAELSRHSSVESRFASHFTDAQLQPNTTYVYRFSSYDEKMHESEASKTYRVTTNPVLSSVSFFDSVGNLPRMAKLIWRPHDYTGVKGYILERQIVEKAEWQEIANIPNRLQAEYIDTDLDDNRVYKYRLRVVTYTDVISTPSEIVKVITKPLPKEIQSVHASNDRPKAIHLNWTAGSEADIEYYKIYRSSRSEGGYDYHAKLNETDFTDEIEEDGESYYYKITAVDKDGLESPMQSSPTLGSTLARPETPSFIDATVENSAARLSWQNNDSRTKSYTIIKTTKESWISSTVQEITGITDTQYTVNDLLPDTQYQFQIIAVDENEISSLPTEPVDVLFSTPDR